MKPGNNMPEVTPLVTDLRRSFEEIRADLFRHWLNLAMTDTDREYLHNQIVDIDRALHGIMDAFGL